ncbi:MAG: HNH endonuclease [Fusobacteriaceae bacterium]
MTYKNLNIPDFEHIRIYENGDVFNEKTKRFIEGDLNNGGYSRVSFYANGSKHRKFRHRLVSEYFLSDTYSEDLQVNHIDGNKTNNHFINLENVTQSQNEQHKQKFLNPKKTTKKVLSVINGVEEIFESQKDFMERFNVSQTTASNWLLWKSKSRTLKFDVLKYI